MTNAAPPEIFKAYDIRGLYGEQIDGDVAEAVGRAFARVLAKLAGTTPVRSAARCSITSSARASSTAG